MFGAHLPELIALLVIALVIFGPKRLPEIGGAVGKSIKEFRRGTQDLTGDHTPDTEAHVAAPPAQIPAAPVQTAPVQPTVVQPVQPAAPPVVERDAG